MIPRTKCARFIIDYRYLYSMATCALVFLFSILSYPLTSLVVGFSPSWIFVFQRPMSPLDFLFCLLLVSTSALVKESLVVYSLTMAILQCSTLALAIERNWVILSLFYLIILHSGVKKVVVEATAFIAFEWIGVISASFHEKGHLSPFTIPAIHQFRGFFWSSSFAIFQFSHNPV